MDVILSTAEESLNMIPLVGQTITDILGGVTYYDTGVTGSIINFINVFKKKAEKRRPNQMSRAVINMANEISQIFGLPIIGVARKLFNAFTDSEMSFNWGEIVNSATGDWVRRLAG